MFSAQHDVLDNFLTLVDIPSESGEEKDIVKYLHKRLKNYTKKVKIDNHNNIFPKGVGNIIAHIPGVKKYEPILLCAHMDTVKPGKNINHQILNNRIVTDGKTILGADDKAGIAAILTLLKLIHKEKFKCCPIDIVFTASEEVGLLGSKNLDFSLLNAKYGYILDSEGPIGSACTKAPSYLYVKVKVIGKAAHSAISSKAGINAIKIAADAISKIPTGKIDKDTSVNIGKIFGGTAINIIPDFTEVEFEIRSYLEHKINKFYKLIENEFKKAAKKFKGKIEIFSEKQFEKYEIPSSSKVVRNFKKVCKTLKITPKLEKSFGGSDSNVFNNNNIETLDISAGYKNPHSTDESIDLKSLNQLVSVIFELVKLNSED